VKMMPHLRRTARDRAVPSDDITMVKVREALKQGGCPICRIVTQSARRYLDGFLYEQVNDPEVRAELVKSRGFCTHHAWMLIQFHDTLGVAIVYRHLVQELARDYHAIAQDAVVHKTARRGAGFGARVRADLRPSRPCPACQIVHRAEEYALTALLQRLEDGEVEAALRGESFFCLPHFVKAAELAQDGQQVRRLAGMQEAMLETMRGHLDELIRKHDYRFRDEGVTSDESVAWMRAIEALVGRDPLEDRLRVLSRG